MVKVYVSILYGNSFFFFSDVIKISYEIISIDRWNRERNEGFSVYNVPFTYGRFIETVDCYRDLGDDTWLNWLEHYFIGGRRKIQLNEFHGITLENDSLNRYGNCTQTTGHLKICRNVIIQRNIDDIDKIIDKKCKNQKLPTISSVLLAYHRARVKLESFAEDS